MKDNILNLLCSFELDYERVYSIQKNGLLKEIPEDCSMNEFTSILSQFSRMGLISHYSNNYSTIGLCMLVEASDFLSRGGFYAQEEILKANIEKLSKELDPLSDKLSPDLLEKANLISGIGANILSILHILKS